MLPLPPTGVLWLFITHPLPLTDLVRNISPQPQVMEVDFMKASSYGLGRSETSGTVKIDDGFDLRSCEGKHVLVVSKGKRLGRGCGSTVAGVQAG